MERHRVDEIAYGELRREPAKREEGEDVCQIWEKTRRDQSMEEAGLNV